MGRDKTLTPSVVEGMVADGRTIVIFEDLVLRLDSWLDKHPGGRLAVLHMVGRDATDEIYAYHSPATIKVMKAFRIGRKPPGIWPNLVPPIRGGTYQPQAASSANADLEDSAVVASGPPTSRYCFTSENSNARCDGGETQSEFRANIRCRAPVHGNSAVDDAPPTTKAVVGDGADPSGTDYSSISKATYTDWAVRQEIDRDNCDFPSLDPTVQQGVVDRYRLLHQRVYDEGFYDCPYLEYGKEMIRYLSLLMAFIIALRYEFFTLSAVFLGLFWHQIMFTAHDAGHRAITHIFVVDTLIGIFIANFCCGMSLGWWKSSHNIHHLVTNQPEHDPDIQNVPLFATCPAFFKSIRSTYYNFTFVWDAVAEVLIPYQQYTYYPIMGIARFNLYFLSWLHVASSKSSSLGSSKAWWIRPTEIIFMLCYLYLFGYRLLWLNLPDWTTRVVFVLVSHIVTMPLHVQITLSHWGMSTSKLSESESFPQRQLRTTMDVDCPAWLDFIHGGLQFQAVHHLFPRVPRHNLRRLQALVKEFCRDTEIPYSILGFVDGNLKVLGRLGEVSDQVRILVNCQRHMAKTGESGLH